MILTSQTTLVAIDSAAWLGISVSAGLVCSLLPSAFLQRDTAITQIRNFERTGQVFRQLGVHRWKNALPETNRVGLGQRESKRRLPPRKGFATLAAETRRAEYVHLMITAAGPLFLLWNPWPLGLLMVIFGVAMNAPFIAIQRYNRLRLLRVIARAAT